ncbi:MAG: hypothetical protein LBS00_03990 [Synergistaceae bacterium]|jgi:hypothetical protein|nr:hypothetical protein [Synergistaceae bacterium]
MYREDVGDISLFWGETGRGEKDKGGWGISHLLKRRDAEHAKCKRSFKLLLNLRALNVFRFGWMILKFSKSSKDHPGMTWELFKQLPRALADPIAIMVEPIMILEPALDSQI